MCDENDLQEIVLLLSAPHSRRAVVALGAAAGLAAALGGPASAAAATLAESRPVVRTPAGVMDCFFVHPAAGAHVGVLLWPDILGQRPAMEALARQLAAAGAAVLVANPYYRVAPAPVVGPGASFSDPAVRERLLPLKAQITAETDAVDAPALIAALDASPAVDKARPLAAIGYCMGGPQALRAAGQLPGRVGFVASFHGAGLVTAGPDSPHLRGAKGKAKALFAIAQNDHAKDPAAKDALAAAYAAAGLPAEIEVYPADHGWCAPDHAAHHPAQAARALGRLLHLLGLPPA